jgi:hypothetical protein
LINAIIYVVNAAQNNIRKEAKRAYKNYILEPRKKRSRKLPQSWVNILIEVKVKH